MGRMTNYRNYNCLTVFVTGIHVKPVQHQRGALALAKKTLLTALRIVEVL